MLLDDFDYVLPAELIAQRPPAERDGARMLLVDRLDGSLTDRAFTDLPTLLRGDELMVFNNARVIPARLLGRRVAEGSAHDSGRQPAPSGQIEVFLSRETGPNIWEALVKPGKKLQPRALLSFGDGRLMGEILERGEFGRRVIEFRSVDARTVAEHFEALGHVPLPPYIDRADEAADRERYQTVFATRPGAVAAPTAGLHFTEGILRAIKQRGIETCEVTLNVGLGTFQPIRSKTLEGHTMHGEIYEIPAGSAEQIYAAQCAGRPILAVGTTVARALEAAALRSDSPLGERVKLRAGRDEARLFIYPGFAFRVVDALLTNFHLPRSTLLALVSAFAGRENVLRAYQHAVEKGYRFYSYGDCMLVR